MQSFRYGGHRSPYLRRSTEEKSTKEGTQDECNAKIQHFTAVISQAASDITDAKATIDTLVSDRALFSKEFESRSAMRSSEMMATQAAYDALQEVTAGAKNTVEGVFLQRAVSHGVPCKRCAAAVRRLQSVGERFHDASLVQVTAALESHLRGTEKDPQAYFDPEAMAPVKGLLKKLISKLEDELAAEKTHHEWCETEKQSAKEAKEEREKNIADLNQEIASLTTTIAQLGTEVEFCISEIARVQQETETVARLRKEEAATYVKAKADHDEVIAALDKAITALSRQYGLVQVRTSSTRAQQKKQSPFSSYQTGAGGSALEMLQDLQSRYSQARTQLVQGEEAAKVAYTDLVARNKQFLKDVQQTKLAKTSEKRLCSTALTSRHLVMTCASRSRSGRSAARQRSRPSRRRWPCSTIRSRARVQADAFRELRRAETRMWTLLPCSSSLFQAVDFFFLR